MNKRSLLFLFAILLAMPSVLVKAEVDTLAWKRLYISEIKLINLNPQTDFGYLELYNGSADTIDLSDYWLQTDWNRIGVGNNAKEEGEFKASPSGMLAPGKTFLITTIGANKWLDPWGDRIYPNDYYHPDLLKMAGMISDGNGHGGGPKSYGSRLLGTSGRIGLFYRGDTSTVEGVVARDSVMVDRFQNDKDENNQPNNGIVAGVISSNAGWEYIHVRKTSFNLGQPDFDISRGTNADNSEWIVLPEGRMNDRNEKLFTTVGSHSNQTELDMTPLISGIEIDKENEIITFPYGVRRDSLFRYFDFGPEHAWDLVIGPDTAQWYVSTGDTIEIYVCGDAVKEYRFHANVVDKPSDFAKVRPLIWKAQGATTWSRRYTVSDGELPMDTISGIGYHTPIDTLMKYLVIEDGSTSEIIFADGKNDIEVNEGDKLKITAGNTTKTYLLSMNRYAPNHDDLLSAIYMPGWELWENPVTFELTDTLITFQNNIKDYIVTLPEGTDVPPAIVATPSNGRSKVHVARPSSLKGDDNARTAVISVTAEDDTSITEYRILFNVERETPEIVGDPFFSDIAFGWGGDVINYQIFNPSDEPIDLSNFVMIKHEGGNSAPWADFVDFNGRAGNTLFGDRSSNQKINKWILRPSYWVNADAQGDCYYTIDQNFSNAELFSKEVYSMAATRSYPFSAYGFKNQSAEHKAVLDKLDMVIAGRGPGSGGNKFPQTWGAGWWLTQRLNYDYAAGKADPSLFPYGEDMWLFGHDDWYKAPEHGGSFMLYKILNDSIADGTKPINKNFAEDHELIDVFNGASQTGTRWVVYDKVNGVDSAFRFETAGSGYKYANFARKPWVYKGNTEELGSFGSSLREGEWQIYGINADGTQAKETIDGVTLGSLEYGSTRFENHTMISYAHIPYISSETYLIGTGLSGVQPILGVSPGTSVDAFMQNIIKPDTGMTVVVMDASSNIVSGSTKITTGFTVKSTAANQQSSVDYAITVGDLSDNVGLVAKAGSGLTVEGKTVKNVPFGWTMIELLDNVIAAETATLVPTDGNEMIIPLEKYNADTLMIEAQFKTETLVSDSYKLEVTAQNGTSVAEYAIEFAPSEDVFVLSDVYKVYEEYKTLDFVWWTNVETFMRNVVASPGASMKIINKIGNERVDGIIQFDDQLVVEKGNKRTVYLLKFVNDDRRPIAVQEVGNATIAGVYPNPTTGAITLSGLSSDNVVTVRNLAGQLIASYNVSTSSKNINIEGPAGVYFVTVVNPKDNSHVSHKVIKQ